MPELRIIGGKLKGRKLKTLPGSEVRPMLSRFKKSLFDILSLRIQGSYFLDLYAGTGSVGIEALSRGAEFAVFIEKDKRGQEIILENLKQFKLLEKAKVVWGDVQIVLGRLAEKFDLIFCGPPYVTVEKKPLFLVKVTLQAVAETNILKSGGWIIFQCQAKETVPEKVGNIALFRTKKYGDTRLHFLVKK